MSCICQYFVHSKDHHESQDSENLHREETALENAENNTYSTESSTSTQVSATELATARAENWLLKKNLTEAHINIENLESLVKTIMDKQNVMLTEMYHLKRLNQELEEECRLQRDYHAMERNAMIRELQDVKELLQERSKQLDESLLKNAELTNEVQDAHGKIYLTGMKYLRLKNDRSYNSPEQSEKSIQSSENEQSE